MDLALTTERSIFGKQMDGDELRWKPPSILLVPILICLALIFFVDVFQLKSYKIPAQVLVITPPKPRFMGQSDDVKGFLIKTEGCRIPYMNPLDSSIRKFIFKEKKIKCNKGKPALMDSNLTSIFTLRSSIDAYSITKISDLNCCYTVFERRQPKAGEPDTKVQYHKDCIKFNESATIKDEFIQVTCKYYNETIYKDTFSFVPITPQVSAKTKPMPLNVLVLGIDAVSRLNFYRQMPKTFKVLQTLKAVDLLGYNKIGDNTFPNLAAVLTGYKEKELLSNCYNNNNKRFDKCPFVWKKYNESGYVTAFGEDAAWMGMFNYFRRGFIKQPTDYYWGHFSIISEKLIGNRHNMNVDECVGARVVHTTLLQYIDKFVTTMDVNKMPYFGFFWCASLTHDYLNKAKLGDDDFERFLNMLIESGKLNNTVLILMSDHGIRWGDIRYTYQGRMEERLPFLFIALPKEYRNKYHQAFNNLRKNARKLITPFDLHETLKDLVDLKELSVEKIKKKMNNSQERRSYSLFEPVPLNRTCESARIESHWCACQESTAINKNDPLVKEATKFAVDHINKKLEGYADCAKLSLAEIYSVRLHTFTEDITVGKKNLKDFTIIFSTNPGSASFEATVRQHIYKDNKKNVTKNYHFNLTGTVSRLNLYGKQSLCITDFHLKLYCYCKT